MTGPYLDTGAAGADELLFLPLGGAGEIGMNLNLYGYGPPGNEDWLMIDLGITFNNGTLPGVQTLMPNPVFIEEVNSILLEETICCICLDDVKIL